MLLDDSLHLVVCDFGQACICQIPGNEPETEEVGTLAYRSPQILSRRSYSQAADLWAVGCILA
jgi:serine/threonine protein kinase